MGPSMLPTMEAHGGCVLIAKHFRRGRGVEIGDVISVKHPMIPGEGAIKRVVGMPGDIVERDTPGTANTMMIQVPEGHCWLIGDNLPHSRDSRQYGPVPLALIKGKVIARVWPWSEWKWIQNGLRLPAVDD
ncbi:MAG: hypothetical protein M1827_001434 [Pycnora praestabilis]|nr:MAG: hypothetical protein M1827_001434 [Pycnora praestabilis]